MIIPYRELDGTCSISKEQLRAAQRHGFRYARKKRQAKKNKKNSMVHFLTKKTRELVRDVTRDLIRRTHGSR